MTQPGDAHLLKALDLAAGRRATGDRPPATWRAYADALVAARARVRKAPRCPRAVLRRAQGLFAARRPSLGGVLLQLVFDSWQTDAAPAFRGGRTARTVRFEGRGAALDLQVAVEADGRHRLLVAAEGVELPATAVVHLGPGAQTRTLELGEDGAGQMLVPGSVRAVEIEIRAGEAVAMRTPRLDLEEPAA